MTTPHASQTGESKSGGLRKNERLAIACAMVVGIMLGVAYAAKPLYDAFCRITGYGGTTQVAEIAPSEVLDRTIRVRFDSNIARGLPWDFEPMQPSQTVRLGENGLAFYRATNHSDQPVTGVATYNVAPAKLGVHFKKIECFCFNEQTLQPGESMIMPVSYYVDPALVDDQNANEVTLVTLSYTFFPATGDPQQTAALTR